jgi:ribosome-associated translation inhibitor RaiA
MELAIRTRDVELTDALREQIERRLELALDTYEDHVQDAFVYLMDLNGPKGGVDKLAQITVRVSRIGELAVRETGTTTSATLNRAARRLKYRLGQALRAEESNSANRSGRWRPQPDICPSSGLDCRARSF